MNVWSWASAIIQYFDTAATIIFHVAEEYLTQVRPMRKDYMTSW